MRLFILTILACFMSITTAGADNHGEAKFDRTTLMVKDIEPSIAFWRDVMGFELLSEPRPSGPGDANPYLGWDETAVRQFTVLYSPDGAGIGLLEVDQDDFPTVDISENPTGYGGVVLVHTAKNIEEIYKRAKAGGFVLKDLSPSPTGRSLQMFLKAPTGHVLEVYEMLPQPGE